MKQVENPENINTEGKFTYPFPLLMGLFFMVLFLGVFLYSPDKSEVTSSKKKDNSTTLNVPQYKDEICNNLTGKQRKIYFEKNKKMEINAYMACSDGEKILGLTEFMSLGENDGMLFVFENPDFYKFWMQDTSIYISAAFLNENLEIIEIHDLEPLSETKIGPETEKTKYVLEMNKGWFEKNNIHPGDKLNYLLTK